MDNTISQNLFAEPRKMLQLLNTVTAEWKTKADILSVWLLFVPEWKPTDNLWLCPLILLGKNPNWKFINPCRCPLDVFPLPCWIIDLFIHSNRIAIIFSFAFETKCQSEVQVSLAFILHPPVCGDRQWHNSTLPPLTGWGTSVEFRDFN